MIEDSSDRRHYTRVLFGAPAVTCQGETRFESKIVDISLNGVLLATPKSYEVKSDMPAIIQLTLADDVDITMQAMLMHSSHSELGFKIESIDMESISHLRRVIELNMDEPNACERVLSELLQRVK